MEQQAGNRRGDRRRLVWGALLVLFGVASLIQVYTTLSVWVWVAILAAAGGLTLAIYLTDPSDQALLIPTYALWAIAGLIALIELAILRGSFAATFVLTAIALPFLIVFLRNRQNWWLLIPAYVLLVIGVIVPLADLGILQDAFVATYILTAIALPFVVVFALDPSRWWALVPAYTLIVVGGLVALIERGILDDLLIPATIMLAIALPFFVVYARNPKEWWPLIPGGIMGLMGLGFLIAEAMVQFVVPAVLILAGIWILARQFTLRGPAPPSEPPKTGPEADKPTESA